MCIIILKSCFLPSREPEYLVQVTVTIRKKKRLGVCSNQQEPKIPFIYILLIWRELQSKYSKTLVVQGQRRSLAREPDCAACRCCGVM